MNLVAAIACIHTLPLSYCLQMFLGMDFSPYRMNNDWMLGHVLPNSKQLTGGRCFEICIGATHKFSN